MINTEYFQDSAGEWRYRIKGGNGEIMVTSEGYTNKSDAVRGMQDLFRNIDLRSDLAEFAPTDVPRGSQLT